MNRTARIFALLLSTVAAHGWAQPVRLSNARVVRDSSRDSLVQRVARITRGTKEPVWVAYAIPLAVPQMTMCCYSGNGYGKGERICSLEREGNTTMSDDDSVVVPGDRSGFVFLRYAEGSLSKIRTFSDDCAVDAAGREVHWLDGVAPEQSVAMLAEGLMERNSKKRLDSQRVHAIAMHGLPAALDTLDRLALSDASDEVRGQALFWLAQTGRERGFQTIRRVVRSESESDRLREKGVFAITQSPVAGAVDELIDLARKSPSAEVRSKALFWLGQKAGRKAAATLKSAVDEDSDSDVREKAVFAISQLPANESVPLLIELARSHKNAGVRKKAMFWLGQTNDPRALEFFEQILR